MPIDIKQETADERRTRHKEDGWIGVDLDGVLAVYDTFRGPSHIGPPIKAMVDRVLSFIDDGYDVRILTARVAMLYLPEDYTKDFAFSMQESLDCKVAIEDWCLKHLGRKLSITAVKDYNLIELWDDRSIQMIPNTGRTLAEEHEAELTALRGKP